MNNDEWVKHLGRPRETMAGLGNDQPGDRRALLRPYRLIYETLGTLNTALVEEILVTVIVILVMVMHLRSSILISALPAAGSADVLHRNEDVWIDANIVALSGIAIAIGTMVDMGIILCENILKHLEEARRMKTGWKSSFLGNRAKWAVLFLPRSR